MVRAGRRDEHGFTIVELLVVVLVIAVVTAIGLPTLTGARSRSQDGRAQSNLRSVLAVAGQRAAANGGLWPDHTAILSEDLSITYVDALDNLYVADGENWRVRKITPAAGVTTLAGTGAVGFADGAATAATFKFLYGVATDRAGAVYVVDGNHAVRKVS